MLPVEIITYEFMKHLSFNEYYPILVSCKALYMCDKFMKYYSNKMKINIIWVAYNGHLEIVQWLSINRNEGCTANAMNIAAREEYLNISQWLQHNRYTLRLNE